MKIEPITREEVLALIATGKEEGLYGINDWSFQDIEHNETFVLKPVNEIRLACLVTGRLFKVTSD